MGFWKTIKGVQDSLLDRDAEMEYQRSSRYDEDTRIIEDYKQQKELVKKIEATTDSYEREKLMNEFTSIQQQTNGKSYELYKRNQKLTEKDAMKQIKKETNLVKAKSMERLYKNKIYNFADLY